MPTLSVVYGIVIRMFYDDHAPPHFYAQYGEHKAVVGIQTLEMIDGDLPPRARALVLEWASRHRAELVRDWDLCQARQAPVRIDPLP
jgi:hypothetical protein